MTNEDFSRLLSQLTGLPDASNFNTEMTLRLRDIETQEAIAASLDRIANHLVSERMLRKY